jgi:hypothetical protein
VFLKRIRFDESFESYVGKEASKIIDKFVEEHAFDSIEAMQLREALENILGRQSTAVQDWAKVLFYEDADDEVGEFFEIVESELPGVTEATLERQAVFLLNQRDIKNERYKEFIDVLNKKLLTDTLFREIYLEQKAKKERVQESGLQLYNKLFNKET